MKSYANIRLWVRVGLHQWFALNPFFFVVLGDNILKDKIVKTPQRMFFAEDVILLGESVEKISIVLEALTKAVEEKGLRVNSKKTDHDLQF